MSTTLRTPEAVGPAYDGEAEVGERITLLDLTTSAVRDYRLVEASEGDADEMPVRTPLGSALLGRHVGDVVSVEEAGGIIRLEVVEIDG